MIAVLLYEIADKTISLFLFQRRANGEDELPEEEDPSVNSLFKPIPQPSRLEPLLVTNQINNYCHQINQFAGQSFGKLFLLDGLK